MRHIAEGIVCLLAHRDFAAADLRLDLPGTEQSMNESRVVFLKVAVHGEFRVSLRWLAVHQG